METFAAIVVAAVVVALVFPFWVSVWRAGAGSQRGSAAAAAETAASGAAGQIRAGAKPEQPRFLVTRARNGPPHLRQSGRNPPRPPARHQVRGDLIGQPIGKLYGADRGELEHLPLDGRHADIPRVLFDRGGQIPAGDLAAAGSGDQGGHPLRRGGRDLTGDAHGEGLLSLPGRRAGDPGVRCSGNAARTRSTFRFYLMQMGAGHVGC